MSAIAQYLQGGPNRFRAATVFQTREYNETRSRLEEGESAAMSRMVPESIKRLIDCRFHGGGRYGRGGTKGPAIGNPDHQTFRIAGADCCQSLGTIALGGTSGRVRPPPCCMKFSTMRAWSPESSAERAGKPDEKGLIGNSARAPGEWLVIEADESDDPLCNIIPKSVLLLNIDKDHKEIETCWSCLANLKNIRGGLCINQSHPLARKFRRISFMIFLGRKRSGIQGLPVLCRKAQIRFHINGEPFPPPGDWTA